MFNVSELIEQVRDSVHEYDSSPMSDDKIVRRLNRAYSFAYNYLVKMNHSLFSGFKYITVRTDIGEYRMPKDCYNKRVHEIFYSQDASHWTLVQRCEPSAITHYQATQSFTGPLYWTQAGEKLLVGPSPSTSGVLKCLITLPLIPLEKVQGKIMDIRGDKLYLDRSPDEDCARNLNRTGMNLISISDEVTGKVKALYPYSESDGESITLSDTFNRTSIRDKPIYKAFKFAPFGAIYYDQLTKVITCNLSVDLTTLIKAGDTLEIQRILPGKYNIIETIENEDDFYNPPEYEVTANTFSPTIKVLEITPIRITFEDTKAVPDFVNGFPYPYDATYTGPITAVTGTNISGYPVIVLETNFHGLLPGKIIKLNITGTGTSLDGTQKCRVVSANQIAVYVPSYSGVFTPGTWSVYTYSSVIITTGWPKIYDVSPSTPLIEFIQLYQGTPNTYLAIPEKTQDLPDPSMVVGDGISSAYDHDNDVKIGDYVTLGYTTGMPVHSDLIEEMLIYYSSLTMKSSINETDNEMLAILKEKVSEIGSDTDGRNLSIELKKPRVNRVANTGRGIR